MWDQKESRSTSAAPRDSSTERNPLPTPARPELASPPNRSAIGASLVSKREIKGSEEDLVVDAWT